LGEIESSLAIVPVSESSPMETHKIVIFTPENVVDTLRSELSKVGAGVTGNYSQCSFNGQGIGTFFGDDSSSPAVGNKLKLEKVNEIRLEMACNEKILPLISEVIRKYHPYESPGWDVYPLHQKLTRQFGVGRIATLKQATPLQTIIENIKTQLGIKYLRVATPRQQNINSIQVKTVAICAGAGSSVLKNVNADLYLTGELRHHDVLDAVESGHSVILSEHTHTERGYLKVLKNLLAKQFNEQGPEIILSKTDVDPLVTL